MAGRMYTAQFSGVAVTAQQDLFMIAPAANKPVIIHALYIAQTSEAGDAEEEFLRYSVIRNHTTVGSGGTAPTPVAIGSAGFGAAGATTRVNDTTIAASGTTVTLHTDTFNIRSGLQVVLTPEMRWGCTSGSTRIVIRLLTTPADSITMSGTVYFEEAF